MTTTVIIYTAITLILIGVLAARVLVLMYKVEDLKMLAERWEGLYFESLQQQNDESQMAYWAELEKKAQDSEEIPHDVMNGIDRHLY